MRRPLPVRRRAWARGVKPPDANPNGSLRASPASCDQLRNVAGLMPHPERAADGLLGADDGMLLLRSLVESAAARERGGIDDWTGTGRRLPATAPGLVR